MFYEPNSENTDWTEAITSRTLKCPTSSFSGCCWRTLQTKFPSLWRLQSSDRCWPSSPHKPGSTLSYWGRSLTSKIVLITIRYVNFRNESLKWIMNSAYGMHKYSWIPARGWGGWPSLCGGIFWLPELYSWLQRDHLLHLTVDVNVLQTLVLS